MGGDHAPAAPVAGAVAAWRAGVPVVLVGDEAIIRTHLGPADDVPICHASSAIGMAESPSSVRRRPRSSIRRAMALAASGDACGVVSVGNSGAALVAAVIEIGACEGVERPAIAVTFPRPDGGSLVLLDAGAGSDAKAGHLACFAALGTAWAEVLGIDNPRVGLLSNGEEPTKGTRVIRAAHELLSVAPVNFVGNVEPDQAFSGACDVLVADGFTGNIVLKTAEGIIRLLARSVRERSKGSTRGALGGLLMRNIYQGLRDDLDPGSRGGALLLGVRSPVVIGHGRAGAEAVCAAVRLAHYASNEGLVARLEQRLTHTATG